MINLIWVWRSSGRDDTTGVDLAIKAGAVKILASAAGNAGWSKFSTFLLHLPLQLPLSPSPASALFHQLPIYHQYPVQQQYHQTPSTGQRASRS